MKYFGNFGRTKEGSMADKNGSASDSGLSGPCFQTSRPPDPTNLSRHRLGRGRRDTLRLAPAEELGVSLEEKLVCIHGESNTTISPTEFADALPRPQRYRQLLANAKLVGAMKFMQLGKVGIATCIEELRIDTNNNLLWT